MNFKQYFLREFLELSSGEKKATKMGMNTGDAHHQRALVGTNLKRKKSYVVAKMHTKKKHEHPKITICLNSKKQVALTHPEAMQIIKTYNVCPTPEENSKAIKQTGVHIVLVSPKVYILAFKGEPNGKA